MADYTPHLRPWESDYVPPKPSDIADDKPLSIGTAETIAWLFRENEGERHDD